MQPDALPGGYCTTEYTAWDKSSAPRKVNVQSVGLCTGEIGEITVSAQVRFKNGTQVATNTNAAIDTAEADTTATYACGTASDCGSHQYKGWTQQAFWNATGWGKPVGACVVSGELMTCAGVFGPWSF